MCITWSTYALNALYNTFDYVEEHFGKKTLSNLKKSVRHINTMLPKQPFAGQIEQLLEDSPIQFRSILASDINRIVYRITENEIVVVDFWDMRRDPDFLAKRISNY